MYEHHFGLSKQPFRITPDPEFFFSGGNRGAVLEALNYAMIRGEGIVKVVGEVGSGKTMLCRMLERELPGSCEVVYLGNPNIPPSEILHAIAFELGLETTTADSKLKVQHALHAYLLNRHVENRRVIMFVEEAQAMPVETLEEVRLLSNLETSNEKLLQIVLFGQPELDEKLTGHNIRQLRERITHAFDLAPFDREQIREYVNARVRGSGYRGDTLFNAAAIRELERHSAGLLRRINVLADKALLAAFAANATTVGPDHVRMAAKDSAFDPVPEGASKWRWAVLGGVAATVALVVIFFLARDEQGRLQAPAVTAQPSASGETVAVPPAPAAANLRSDQPESGISAGQAARFDDNQNLLPTLSERTGLVTTAHLRPRLEEGTPVAAD
ncbi:MAG: ExeA family protein [Gammaproteobacteria bacterium]